MSELLIGAKRSPSLNQTHLLIDNRWQSQQEFPLQSPNAEIWQVTDTLNEFPGLLALKRLKRIDRRARFAQEVRALTKLSQHPDLPVHIIRLLAARVSDGGDRATSEPLYLVTPWVPGGDARLRVLNEKSYQGDLNSTLKVILPLIQAVDFLHKQALAEAGYIAHRDLKPGNILFDEGDIPVLTDFGCAYFDARHTATSEVVGSLGYAAPEMLDGRYEGDLRPADIYSFGALLYAFLAGDNPPMKKSVLDPEYNLAARFDDSRLLEVNKILDWCMTHEPGRRPSADELFTELKALLEPPAGKMEKTISSVVHRLQLLAYDPEVRAKIQSADTLTSWKEHSHLAALASIRIWQEHQRSSVFIISRSSYRLYDPYPSQDAG